MTLRKLSIALFGLWIAAHSACAADLMDVWRAAQVHDLDYSAEMSARKAGQLQGAEASALWRPTYNTCGGGDCEKYNEAEMYSGITVVNPSASI